MSKIKTLHITAIQFNYMKASLRDLIEYTLEEFEGETLTQDDSEQITTSICERFKGYLDPDAFDIEDEDVQSVYDYFKEKLGVAPDETSLSKLPVDSKCGHDCCSAIDAIAETIKHLHNAGDHDENLIKHANDIVNVYYLG